MLFYYCNFRTNSVLQTWVLPRKVFPALRRRGYGASSRQVSGPLLRPSGAVAAAPACGAAAAPPAWRHLTAPEAAALEAAVPPPRRRCWRWRQPSAAGRWQRRPCGEGPWKRQQRWRWNDESKKYYSRENSNISSEYLPRSYEVGGFW